MHCAFAADRLEPEAEVLGFGLQTELNSSLFRDAVLLRTDSYGEEGLPHERLLVLDARGSNKLLVLSIEFEGLECTVYEPVLALIKYLLYLHKDKARALESCLSVLSEANDSLPL